MALLPSSAIPSASGGYTIDQSLRFNDDDDASLNKTWGSSPTEANRFTFSVWVKRGVLDSSTAQYWLLGAKSSAESNIKFYEDKLYLHLTGSNYDFITDAVFRDTSAWYHIVVTYDSDDGTPADRCKIYVNGVRQSLSTSTTIPSGTDNEFTKNGTECWIGSHDASNFHFDGYMADVYLIDGTAYDADDFGEEGDYGEWKPKEVTGLTYGTNGFYLSFAGGGVMSATGGDSIGTDGDYKYNTFLSDGTFTPSSITGDGHVEYLVIAGGGGGGHTYYGGGGGAGGYKTGMLSVTAQAYAITVGDGGAQHTQGDNSSIASEVVATGGGAGGNTTGSTGEAGGTGGSGGGGGNASGAGGSGTTGQGNDGGTAPAANYSAGGGGAGTAGSDNVGGNGLASSITGSSVTRAGGGGGGYHVGYGSGGTGGSGGGGQGGEKNDLVESGNGTPNTGSGGGGSGASDEDAGSGGSGIVIIRYKFQ